MWSMANLFTDGYLLLGCWWRRCVSRSVHSVHNHYIHMFIVICCGISTSIRYFLTVQCIDSILIGIICNRNCIRMNGRLGDPGMCDFQRCLGYGDVYLTYQTYKRCLQFQIIIASLYTPHANNNCQRCVRCWGIGKCRVIDIEYRLPFTICPIPPKHNQTK